MYYREGMERRLRKGDAGEALYREWFERQLSNFFSSRGFSLEQQGFNPGGFVDRGKKHLKEKSDPDYAVYPSGTGKPIVGISVNTQGKFYTAESAMGKGCIKCPRAYSCHNGNERNLWYNKYNLSDYDKFEQRFGVETCMVTLRVNVGSVVEWVENKGYRDIVHWYILDGGKTIPKAEKPKLPDVVRYLRHGARKEWERHMEIKWVFCSELKEITPASATVPKGRIPFWTTGGRVERGRPRPVCCVDAKYARGEQELTRYLTKLAK